MNLFLMSQLLIKLKVVNLSIMFHNIEMSEEEKKRRFLNIFHKNGKLDYTKARAKQILEVNPEELKKENDFVEQRDVNILKNHDNTKGVITRIIPDPKH